MLSSYRPSQRVIWGLMMYMLFAMELCRNKHVTPSSTDVYYTTITETAMHCTKFPNIKQKQRMIVREYWCYLISFPLPPFFFFTNRHDEYQQSDPSTVNKRTWLIMHPKVTPWDFFVKQKLTFSVSSPTLKASGFCISLSRGQEKALASAIETEMKNNKSWATCLMSYS